MSPYDQKRSEEEQKLPQSELDALDRRRNALPTTQDLMMEIRQIKAMIASLIKQRNT